jgi:hypothetical protein
MNRRVVTDDRNHLWRRPSAAPACTDWRTGAQMDASHHADFSGERQSPHRVAAGWHHALPLPGVSWIPTTASRHVRFVPQSLRPATGFRAARP